MKLLVNRYHSPNSQRGYNLIEMSLALVILGLLLGGVLVPLQVSFQREEINKTRDYMQQARAALFVYALQHRTFRHRLTYHDGIVYETPSKRPYLPCPDVDSDGLEDRHVLPDGQVEVSLNDFFGTPRLGTCQHQKGTLPYKTLGLQRGDSWGNLLTYWVDMSFSDQLLGFDETTRADIFDLRAPLLPDGPRYALRAGRGDVGAVVCSNYYITGSAPGCPDDYGSNLLTGVMVYKAAVTVGAITSTAGGSSKVIPPYNQGSTAPTGIYDGAVFVLVSHGRNGFGAIGVNNECRDMPVSSVNYLAEWAHAYHDPASPLGTRPCLTTPPMGSDLYINQFVKEPLSRVSDADQERPDDMLLWAGSNELIGFLAGNAALSIEKISFLPYE